MGQVVLCHWQDHSPKTRPWRFWGVAVPAAGVRGVGLAVEAGPQSLDINVLLLKNNTGAQTHFALLCFWSRKLAAQCTARHAPYAHKHTPLVKPPRYLYEVRMHRATTQLPGCFDLHRADKSPPTLCSTQNLLKCNKAEKEKRSNSKRLLLYYLPPS